MNQNEHNQPSDYERLVESLANFSASDETIAEASLNEEGINIEEVVKQGLSFIEKLKKESNLKAASLQRKKFESPSIQTKFREWLNEKEASLRMADLQLNFRDFKELDKIEIDRIKYDALFIKFLEENNITVDDE